MEKIHSWKIQPYLIQDGKMISIPEEFHNLDDTIAIMEFHEDKSPYSALSYPMAAAYFSYSKGWDEGDIFDIWDKFYEDLITFLDDRYDDYQDIFDFWDDLRNKDIYQFDWEIIDGILEISLYIGEGALDINQSPTPEFSKYTNISKKEWIDMIDDYQSCRDMDLMMIA